MGNLLGSSRKENSLFVNLRKMTDSKENARRISEPVPPSLDLIEENLWLGNLSAATDVDTLQKYHINHILTVDSVPLPRKITDKKDITCLYLKLTDMPSEDIISHFPETYQFIEDGVKTGVVLVHCYFGVSRSATIVLAYLMKRHNLPYKEAMELLRSKRSCTGPNAGFRSQLRLYENMNFRLDLDHVHFRMFRLHTAADQIKRVKILPHNYLDVIKSDPALEQVNPDPRGFRCRKCRRMVALVKNILPHVPDRKYNWNDKHLGTLSVNEMCNKTFFIEPIAWMKNITQSLEGKLHCDKCQSKLGSFSWIMGCQCPCGTKVQPAFYLVPSKVDSVNSVKNVQVTI